MGGRCYPTASWRRATFAEPGNRLALDALAGRRLGRALGVGALFMTQPDLVLEAANARRTINGTDPAGLIAACAVRCEAALMKARARADLGGPSGRGCCHASATGER